MSIKDLFNKGHSLKSVKNKNQDDLVEDVESHRYVDAYSEKRDRFLPGSDFFTASNFARFGLAEEYYDTAIKRIYQTYPYDGSSAEKIEWENDSTYLDLFIFENGYPRTNGFVIINSSSHTYTTNTTGSIYSSSAPQYITFYGGPHQDPGGNYKSDFSAGPSKIGISKANIYHTASQQGNNLELDLSKGVTVEFWLKKDGWASTSADKDEYIFHNVASGSTDPSYSSSYGSLRVRTRGKTDQDHLMVLIAESGSTSMTFSHDTGLSNIADSAWHHYAITAKSLGAGTISNLYVDGTHVSRLEDADTTISAVTGAMLGAVGALAWSVSSSTNQIHASGGWGNIVNASFDEFRYWKTQRSAEQIGRFYRDQVGGGTNTDNVKYDDVSNKVNLGIYFKFNEGITGESSTDSTILDYSGRISNGTFINYDSECRNTDSAIVLSNAATKEFKDPIIYSGHPDVSGFATEKQTSGSAHDQDNIVSIYKSFPTWILEEDERDSNHLKYLTQIIASYFDDLYLQIQNLPRLKDVNYIDSTNYEKPLPFADRLLSSRGFDAPELFADASDLAKYLERDERVLFEKKLHEVKNIIYQNIYNNLTFIQKSKGTYKCLRNFLRCFGVDEELIKLNIYSNNDTYKFKDNVTHTSVRKNYIDFDDLETNITASGHYQSAYTATAYQYYDSTDSNSLSYIPATSGSLWSGSMMTIETEVIFPRRSMPADENFILFPASGSSIFGLHAVNASNTDSTFNSNDTINFNIVARKTDNDLRNVKFAVESSGGSAIFATLQNSSSFAGTYDNEKWNLAFRLRPTKTKTDNGPALNTSTGFFEPAASAYTYELYGVNYLSSFLQNEFTLSGTISLSDAETFFTKPKKIFIGASRTNFTGSIRKHSDVKISSTRVWLDYLSDETIRAHAKDANSYGALQPYRNTNDSLNTNYVPQISTLILNWTMENVTGSNSNGQFLIEDFASGSSLRDGGRWGIPISKYNYAGRGDKFTTNTDFLDRAVDVDFVQSAKLKLPEVVNSDDMIKILNKQDDVVFTRDTTYVQHLLSVEKSMYQIISEEMLRMFASVANFNNLIGEPVNKYRPHYKKIEKLRELFFESVENERLDLDKFIEYFKWIDEAITIMIAQLIPASSTSVETLRNMVESHILERNKYYNKFPTLESKPRIPEASLRGIEELKYNWKFGHAPLVTSSAGDDEVLSTTAADQNVNQNKSCLWWKQRAERTGSAAVLTSGVNGVDASKNVILKTAITEVTGTEPTLKTSTGTKYAGSYYGLRSLARPIDLTIRKTLNLKAGSNPQDNNRHDFYKSIIKWGSDDDFIYLDADNEISRPKCNDQEIPVELDKKEFRMKALVMPANETLDSNAQGTETNDQQYTDAKSTLVLPFNIFSSSVDTGYRQQYITGSMPKIEFTNMHEDKYGHHAEIPLQGPFTEKHVGGMQHRHVNLNQGSDTQLTRPEGWHLQEFLDLWPKTTQFILQETFSNATTTVSTDVATLSLPHGSEVGDPSEFEYWRNGTNGYHLGEEIVLDNEWSFIKGGTPSKDTGPGGSAHLNSQYAYCEVTPDNAGQQFSLVTPLIDLLDVDSTSEVRMYFKYHMHGTGIGDLKVQASGDRDFRTGVEDLMVDWGTFNSTVITGQQHTSDEDSFTTAWLSSDATYGAGLKNWLGRRFYIRFFYTASPITTGDCAIDLITLYLKAGETPGDETRRNSFKLLNPTYDSLRRPSAIYTRDTLAKRPVNIRNIEMTGGEPGAAATITVADGDAANGMTEKEHITLISTDGTSKRYVITNAASDGSTDTGTVLSDSDNTDTGAGTAAGAEDGGIAVSINLSSATQNAYLVQLKAAIEHANGHNGKILVSAVPTEANGEQSITLTQAPRETGTDANSTVTTDIEQLTVTDFTAVRVTPTVAGNYLDRYEYISTMSPEVNDPWFIKNVDSITRTTSEMLGLGSGSIETILSAIPSSSIAAWTTPAFGAWRTGSHIDYTLPDRTYLTGTTKNRTRFKSRFRSPGGFEVMSRGFLDPAHEIYSVYNAMPWRNNWGRRVLNSQLQAHMGKFGVGVHTEGTTAIGQLIMSTATPANLHELSFTISDGNIVVTFTGTTDWNKNIYKHNSRTLNIYYGAKNVSTTTHVRDTIRGALDLATSSFGLQIKHSIVHPRTGATPVNVIYVTQLQPGVFGNTAFTHIDMPSNIIGLWPGSSTYGIREGTDPTARVYGSELTGSIGSASYSFTEGDASRHKYHRNNVERIRFAGDQAINEPDNTGFGSGSASTSTSRATYFTASLFDNGFVSHMIPRTDNQTRWITASLI
jgi:hypothetical protein